jgi:hypothetical protein
LGISININEGLLGWFSRRVGNDFAPGDTSTRGWSHAADRFMNVNEDIRFVNNFPDQVRTISCLQKPWYLLSDEFLDDVFESDDTDSAFCLGREVRDKHHVGLALLEEVEDIKAARLGSGFGECRKREIAHA